MRQAVGRWLKAARQAFGLDEPVRRPIRRTRLQLEALESRLVPTTNYHWVGGLSTNPTGWLDGRNWADDSGTHYSANRYPGTGSDDYALFDSNATQDCNLTGTSIYIEGLSADANFSNTLNINYANLAVDSPSVLQNGGFILGNNSKSTFSGQLVIKGVSRMSVGVGSTLTCNGDADYSWGTDTVHHTSLAVDGTFASLTIDGGGTVQVANNAFFPHGGILQFTDRGVVATFSGSGGTAYFDSGVIQSVSNGNSRNFDLHFVGIDVYLEFNSKVNLGVVTSGANSYWTGIDALQSGANGGHFTVGTSPIDNVTLNMDANAKPNGTSHTVIYADVDLSGSGFDIFQNFTKTGNWQAWKTHDTSDDQNFILTY